MRHVKLFASIVVFSLFVITGCKKEVTSSSSSASPVEGISAKQSDQFSASLKDKFTKLQALLPTAYKKGLIAKTQFSAKLDPQYRDIVRGLLRVTATPCDPNTALVKWLDQQLANWSNDAFYYASALDLYDVPAYYALVFENSSANQTFGENGEYTHTLTKTFKDLKRFWDIQSNNIVLVAMHGSMLQDRDKLIETYVAVYGLDTKTASAVADFVLELLKAFPEYRNGEHPIFTFNSFSSGAFNFPPYGVIPPKIIMGDGILEAYTAIGYGDVAPQAILAHEYGHQVQFQLHIFEENTPESTRQAELMADAFSAYYLSHARGASMQWKRVKQFLQVFYNIGDCAFDVVGHHGTPLQRMASAEWAYHLADNAQKQGHILPAQTFVRLFYAAYPSIIAQ